ncbi:hypothetical protein AVEN_63055-1 [Araneus ventricosus]|uniref:Uncharacterized protein n=1 Tax=Araneus ventricosus TaxID=182803 RepID=A0A4Y2H454_ARAVE|nr:hypothetical protein AVEN_63055-1 [Araneus ventricosus]
MIGDAPLRRSKSAAEGDSQRTCQNGYRVSEALVVRKQIAQRRFRLEYRNCRAPSMRQLVRKLPSAAFSSTHFHPYKSSCYKIRSGNDRGLNISLSYISTPNESTFVFRLDERNFLKLALR